MASPAFVPGTELDGNISSGGTVTWAAGGANDIIVVGYGCYEYTGTNTPSMPGFTVPTNGFHQGANTSQFESSTGHLLKAAGGTAGGSAALTITNAGASAIDWVSVRVSGANTSTLYDVAQAEGGNAFTYTISSLTASAVDTLMIISNFGNSGITVGPSGFTNSAQWSGSTAEGMWFKAIAASGATGSFSITSAGSGSGWGAASILIPAAIGGGPAFIATQERPITQAVRRASTR